MDLLGEEASVGRLSKVRVDEPAARPAVLLRPLGRRERQGGVLSPPRGAAWRGGPEELAAADREAVGRLVRGRLARLGTADLRAGGGGRGGR